MVKMKHPMAAVCYGLLIGACAFAAFILLASGALVVLI